MYLFIVIWGVLKCVHAQYLTNCEIDGIGPGNWITGYKIPGLVEVTYEGVVETLHTKNILEMTLKENEYLTATFESNNIQILTTPKFKEFKDDVIPIQFKLKCSDGAEPKLSVRISLTRTVVPEPVLNLERYEYTFGMAIPPNFDLTEILPIVAADSDAHNKIIYFESENSNLFKIEHQGRPIYNDDANDDLRRYATTLKTTREIRAPFEEQFSIAATKRGKPEKRASAVVTVSVLSDILSVSSIPVFSNTLYFASYEGTGDFEVERILLIQGARDDSVIKHSAFSEYFDVGLENINNGTAIVKVTNKMPLSKGIMDTNEFITLELEARNPDTLISGRATLLIRLATPKKCSLIFEKKLHFGKYTDKDGLILEEPIVIKQSAQEEITVRLLNYSDYFSVYLEGTLIVKAKFRQIPNELLQERELLLQIEATNQLASISDQTTLLVHLDKSVKQQKYYVHLNRFSNIGLLVTVAVIAIATVCLNIIIMKWYYENSRGPNGVATVSNLYY